MFIVCTAAPLAPFPKLSRRAIKHRLGVTSAKDEEVDAICIVTSLTSK